MGEDSKEAVAVPVELIERIDLDEPDVHNGYVLDVNKYSNPELIKTAADRQTVLIPQPTDDPADPLNWSHRKKHVMLGVIIACTFLPDYACVTGSVTLIPQAVEYHLSPNTVLHPTAGNILMIGIGGFVAVVLSSYFGRLPTLFWFMVASLITAIAQAGIPGFLGYYIPRIMNGFFAGASQGCGLMYIKDMFFLHEQAWVIQIPMGSRKMRIEKLMPVLSRKINTWSAFLVLSPFLGPLLAAFMLTSLNWRWPFWIYAMMTAVCLLVVIFLGEETYYSRHVPLEQRPIQKSRIMRLLGVEQWQSRHLRGTFYESLLHPLKTILKPVVLLTNLYFMCICAWLLGINTTITVFIVSLYDFGPKQIGLFFFSPLIATFCAWFVGHWLHDGAAKLYIRHHNGRLEPEVRLVVAWIVFPGLLAGIILIGFALQQPFHYAVTAFAWGLYLFCVDITTVGVNAYLMDAYPADSGEVGMWINFSRLTGGFIISYFQLEWVGKLGAEKAFGIQAGILAAFFPIIVILQFYGKHLRVRTQVKNDI